MQEYLLIRVKVTVIFFPLVLNLKEVKRTLIQKRQYDSLVDTCQDIVNEYDSLEAEAIVGHKDIAAGRKDDPWEL